MFAKRFFRSFFISSIAMVINLLIAIAVANLIPVPVSTESYPQQNLRDEVFTKQDLDKAERAMKGKIQKYLIESEHETFQDRLSAIKRNAAFLSWLPWLLLPLVFPVKNHLDILYLLVLPVILIFTKSVWIFEVPLFALALAMGVFLSHQLHRKPKRKPEGTDHQ